MFKFFIILTHWHKDRSVELQLLCHNRIPWAQTSYRNRLKKDICIN